MANEIGTSSAPSKAAGKSSNVSGAQVQQMLVQRQATAPEKPATAEIVAPEPVKPVQEPTKTAPIAEAKPASQPEEKKPEVKAEQAEHQAEAPDEVLSKLSPEQQERIDKRIGKEVGKRKALEEEVARWKAIANATPQAKPAAPEPSRENPLGDVTDVAELQKKIQSAEETKYWAQEQLDRDDLGDGVRVGDMTYGKPELRAIVRNADRLITKQAPERVQFLQRRAQHDQRTAEMFGSESWMQDRSSEAFQIYQQIRAEPDIAKRENASWIAAVQVQGLLDVQRRSQAAGKKAEPIAAPAASARARAPAAPHAEGGGFAPEREATTSRSVKELGQDLDKLLAKKGVTGRDVAAYLLKVEQSRSAR